MLRGQRVETGASQTVAILRKMVFLIAMPFFIPSLLLPVYGK
jgi:hypothetical protein